jgi:DNA-binding transcriptional regulator YdaS (Cro superfamily)
VSTQTAPDTSAIDRAIRACGSVAALADRIGVTASLPSMWKARGRVPSDHCAAIEQATGGAVTRRELRPDDWQRIWPELAAEEQRDAA